MGVLKKVLVLLMLCSVAAFGQIGNKRVRADSLMSFVPAGPILVWDTLNLHYHTIWDSVGIVPTPASSKLTLYARGLRGLWMKFANGDSVRMADSTMVAAGGADNLGNHTATQDLDMNTHDIVFADSVEANNLISDGAEIANDINVQRSGYFGGQVTVGVVAGSADTFHVEGTTGLNGNTRIYANTIIDSTVTALQESLKTTPTLPTTGKALIISNETKPTGDDLDSTYRGMELQFVVRDTGNVKRKIGTITASRGIAGGDYYALSRKESRVQFEPNNYGSILNRTAVGFKAMDIDFQQVSGNAVTFTLEGNLAGAAAKSWLSVDSTANGNVAVGFADAFVSGGTQFNPTQSRTDGAVYIQDRTGASERITTTPHGLFHVERTGPATYDPADDINAAYFKFYNQSDRSTQPANVGAIKAETYLGTTAAADTFSPRLAFGVASKLWYRQYKPLQRADVISSQFEFTTEGSDSVSVDTLSGLRVSLTKGVAGSANVNRAWGVYVKDNPFGTLESSALRFETTGQQNWNNDAFLSRSAAKTLRLDSTLNVTGRIQINGMDVLDSLRDIGGPADNLGNHQATQRLDMNDYAVVDVDTLKFTDSASTIRAGNSLLLHNSGGNYNFFAGIDAGKSVTTGQSNVGLGWRALYSITSPTYNTAVGAEALNKHQTQGSNTALGYRAMFNDTTGYYNTALGYLSLFTSKTAYQNTGVGYSSLYSTTTGSNNTALGMDAGYSNTTGTGNVFLGFQAGYNAASSNKLYINNSNSDTSLIYGDFASPKVGIYTPAPDSMLTVQKGGHFLRGLKVDGSITGIADSAIYVRNGGTGSSEWTDTGTRLYPTEAGDTVYIRGAAGDTTYTGLFNVYGNVVLKRNLFMGQGAGNNEFYSNFANESNFMGGGGVVYSKGEGHNFTWGGGALGSAGDSVTEALAFGESDIFSDYAFGLGKQNTIGTLSTYSGNVGKTNTMGTRSPFSYQFGAFNIINDGSASFPNDSSYNLGSGNRIENAGGRQFNIGHNNFSEAPQVYQFGWGNHTDWPDSNSMVISPTGRTQDSQWHIDLGGTQDTIHLTAPRIMGTPVDSAIYVRNAASGGHIIESNGTPVTAADTMSFDGALMAATASGVTHVTLNPDSVATQASRVVVYAANLSHSGASETAPVASGIFNVTGQTATWAYNEAAGLYKVTFGGAIASADSLLIVMLTAPDYTNADARYRLSAHVASTTEIDITNWDAQTTAYIDIQWDRASFAIFAPRTSIYNLLQFDSNYVHYQIDSLGTDLRDSLRDVAADQVTLNEVQNPTADKTFSMGNKDLSFTYTTGSSEPGHFQVEGTGNYAGDLFHVHQHTGNPPVGAHLAHFEAEDADVIPLKVMGANDTAAVITGGRVIVDSLIALYQLKVGETNIIDSLRNIAADVITNVSVTAPVTGGGAAGSVTIGVDTSAGKLATKADVNAKANSATTITVAATAPLASSAGAQDLSTNRAWTITADTAVLATQADINLKKNKAEIEAFYIAIDSSAVWADTTRKVVFIASLMYPITIDSIMQVGVGTTSLVPKFNYGTDVSAAGTRIINSPATLTASTTVNKISSFDNASIPAGNAIWLSYTTVTTKPVLHSVTIKYHRTD